MLGYPEPTCVSQNVDGPLESKAGSYLTALLLHHFAQKYRWNLFFSCCLEHTPRGGERCPSPTNPYKDSNTSHTHQIPHTHFGLATHQRVLWLPRPTTQEASTHHSAAATTCIDQGKIELVSTSATQLLHSEKHSKESHAYRIAEPFGANSRDALNS